MWNQSGLRLNDFRSFVPNVLKAKGAAQANGIRGCGVTPAGQAATHQSITLAIQAVAAGSNCTR
jgi:hypothetical protein